MEHHDIISSLCVCPCSLVFHQLLPLTFFRQLLPLTFFTPFVMSRRDESRHFACGSGVDTSASRSTRMPKKNFYAVAKGKTPGIYQTWAQCEAQTKGCANQYKGFVTLSEASAYMQERGLSGALSTGGASGSPPPLALPLFDPSPLSPPPLASTFRSRALFSAASCSCAFDARHLLAMLGTCL